MKYGRWNEGKRINWITEEDFKQEYNAPIGKAKTPR